MYKRLPYLALAILSLAFATPLRAGPSSILHSWDIDAAKNTVTLHLINATGKDITAYNIKIRETYGPQVHEHEISRDTVGLMLKIQEHAGTPEADELKRFGNGTFPSGANRDETTGIQPGLTDFSAAVDSVIYSDKTAESTNPDGLKRLLDARKSFATTIQAGNAIIEKALADPTDANPHETALKQIAVLQRTWDANHPANLNAGALHQLQQDLKYAGTAATEHGQSIRDYLAGYVSKRSEHAARLLEHAKAGAQ